MCSGLDCPAALCALGAMVAAPVAPAASAVAPAAVAALRVVPALPVRLAAGLAFAACRETVPSEGRVAPAASAMAPAVAMAAAERVAVPLGRGRDLGRLAPKEALQPSEESLLLGHGRLLGRPLLTLGEVARVARLPRLAWVAGLPGIARIAGIARVAVLADVTPEGVAAGFAALCRGRAGAVLPAVGTERGPVVALRPVRALAAGRLPAERRGRLPADGRPNGLCRGQDLDFASFCQRLLLGLLYRRRALFDGRRALLDGRRGGHRDGCCLCNRGFDFGRLLSRQARGLWARERVLVLALGCDDGQRGRLIITLNRGCCWGRCARGALSAG